jgi:hypothetical protein
MPEIVCIRVSWDRTAIPLRIRGYHMMHVSPEPEHPFGRKGATLTGAWRQLSTPAAAGMLILDGDVAIDPLDHAAMLTAIHHDPAVVHVAPVRLWPVSTRADGWMWGHGNGRFSADEDPDDPDVFTFCFTYLPKRLIEGCIKAGMPQWTYPNVDRRVQGQAQAMRIPARVVRGASPKHLNF